MKKISFEKNDMNNLIQKEDTLKQNKNNTPSSILKTFKRSKSSLKSNKKRSNKSVLTSMKFKNEQNTIQENKLDINSRALETLTEVALNIKHLLSDFLINVDPEDKQIFHINDELKKIRENNQKNSSHIYSFLGGIDSDRETKSPNKSKIIYEKEENKINELFNYKSFNKRSSKKFEFNLEQIENEDNMIIKNYKTMKSIKNKPNIDKYYESEQKKKKRMSIHTVNTKNYKNKKLDFFGKKKKSDKNINKKKISLKSLININKENDNKDDSKAKLIYSENSNNDEKDINLKILNQKKTSLKKLNDIDNSNDTIYIPKTKTYNFSKKNIKKNINNYKVNSSSDDSESQNDIKINNESKINKKFQTIIENKKPKKDKNDIRNYINLNEKTLEQFNNLCNGLKKSITICDSKEEDEFEENEKKNKISISEIERKKKYKEENDLDYHLNEINIINKNEKIIKELQFRRLIKQKNYVYDSLSDEESLEEKEEGKLFINPNGIFLIIFDMIILILSIYAIIFSPIKFAFTIEKIPNLFSKSSMMDFIIDFFFFSDFIIGFFTAFYDFDEQLITNNKLIIKQYLKKWFTINFISGIPFNSIFKMMDYYQKSNTIVYAYTNNFWKILQLFQLIRLFKLYKTFNNNSFINSIHKKMKRIDGVLLKWFTLYMALFIFFVSVHLLSCIFIYLSKLSHPNWVYLNDLNFQKNKIDIYIASLYYICATVFTIGYGDIVSISLYERIFNLILLFVGIIIYSFFVSFLSNYVQNMDSKALKYSKKIEILQNIRVEHETMPQELFEKISKFLLYDLANEKKDKHEIIDNLPLSLRNKLIMEMYKDIINNFIFFKNFNNTDFIIRVILALKPIQAEKNEKLVNEGDYIDEIIFVKKGRLSLEIPIPLIIKKETINKIQTIRHSRASLKYNLTKNIVPFEASSNNNNIPNIIDVPTKEEIKEDNFLKKFDKIIKPQKHYLKIIEIRKNEYFGDILMFLNKKSPLSVKVKSNNCELFLLKKADAVEISMNFPKIWRKIIKKSLFNMEQIERLINKTLNFFLIHNEGNKNENDEINYFRIDPNGGNKLLNANNMINSFKNKKEKCVLQSIPSDENEEEENEEEKEENEEENEEEEKENPNKIKKSLIKTINEVEEFSLDSNSLKSKNSQSSLKSNYESQLNSSDSEKSSINSKKTIITNPTHKFIDYITEKSSKENETLISSNYHYFENEINKENFPFEESIEINQSENISNGIIPKEIMNCSNLSNHIILNDSESLESVKKKYPNSILMLLNCEFQNNNSKLHLNDINKNRTIIKKSSFDFIRIEKLENFSLKGGKKKTKNFEYLIQQFNNDIKQKNNDKFQRRNSLPNSKTTKSVIKNSNDMKNSFLDKFNAFNNSPINRKKLNKMMFIQIEKLKNNEKISESESPLNSKHNYLNDNISIIDMMNTMKSSNFSNRKRINSTKNIGVSNTINKSISGKSENTYNPKNNEKNNSSENLSKLNLIRNNIKKNSLNLNNPNSFYSEFFSSFSNKEEYNKSNINFSQRLKNIAKIIEKHNKRDFNENLDYETENLKSNLKEKT